MRVGHAITICAVGLMAYPAFTAERSPVADAAMKGDVNAVRELLRQKADVNAAQADGATAIQWAAYRNNLFNSSLLESVRIFEKCFKNLIHYEAT